MIKKKLPVNILNGFLDARKTTVLNHILHNKQGLKITVIVPSSVSLSLSLEGVIENYEEYDDIIPSSKERLKKLKLRKLIYELRQTLKKSIEIVLLIQFKFLFQTVFCHADAFGCNI
nr:GTP-binding protein [Myroides indicus]